MSETRPMTLAEQARANYDKFITSSASVDDIYEGLVKIIKDVSSKGSVGLDVFYQDDPEEPAVILDEPEYYINVKPRVCINSIPIANLKILAERLEADGFKVECESTPQVYIIDSILWV